MPPKLPLNSRTIGIGVALAWFIGVLAIGGGGSLTVEANRMLAIFGAAIALWVSEAIPLSATAIGIILAQILMVSDEAILPISEGFEPAKYSSIYASLASPVLMLFLGGFVLANAAAKYRMDKNLARVLLKPFGTSPKALLAGLMAITALLSMFMSNTATTAAMIAVVIPVTAGLDPSDRFRAGLILSIPVAANVGGIGTPVGTPPNAIALGRLADEGLDVSFVHWMGMALPISLVVLAFAWFVLAWRYPSDSDSIELGLSGTFDRSAKARILYVTFAVTVVGWLTGPIHGVPAAVVGFLPVVVLLSTGVMTVDDIKDLGWHVLWLVGGGIALGNGVSSTGLDDWMVGLLDWSSMPELILVAALGALALTLSTVISNSATANLLIPIGVSLALSDAVSLDPLLAGVLISVSCSLAMALPVSTPPNAVAYSTGSIETKDLAQVGLAVGLFGLLLTVFVGPLFWSAVGLV